MPKALDLSKLLKKLGMRGSGASWSQGGFLGSIGYKVFGAGSSFPLGWRTGGGGLARRFSGLFC